MCSQTDRVISCGALTRWFTTSTAIVTAVVKAANNVLLYAAMLHLNHCLVSFLTNNPAPVAVQQHGGGWISSQVKLPTIKLLRLKTCFSINYNLIHFPREKRRNVFILLSSLLWWKQTMEPWSIQTLDAATRFKIRIQVHFIVLCCSHMLLTLFHCSRFCLTSNTWWRC